MKKCLFWVSCVILGVFLFIPAYAEPLQGGISMIENVPKSLYGSWQVLSIQTYTNNEKYTAPVGVDFWNIYRIGDVLTLENPQTTARASVTIKEVKDNRVTFVRTAKRLNGETIETPTITIVGEDFWGTDKMVMKKYKNGSLISTDVVEFSIRGKKIGGQSAAELLN